MSLILPRVSGFKSILVSAHIVTLALLALPFASESFASTTLLRNAALVITMDPKMGEGELGILENTDVRIVDGAIDAIGENLTADVDRVVDATGKIVMPGLIDLHNHLFQSVMRGCGTDKDISGWLETCIYPLSGTTEITEADAYAGVRLGALNLLNSGVTTVADWSSAFNNEFVEGNLRALDEAKIRFFLAYKTTFIDPALTEHLEAIKNAIAQMPLGGMQMGPVPSMREPLRSGVIAAVKLAKKWDLQLHTHLHEGPNDRAAGQITSLVRAGGFGPHLLAAHAVHLTDEEIDLIAKHGVKLAHNPLSNMRIGSGVMRLKPLLIAGIPVGLGQDGGALANEDMFETMRLAINLQRVVNKDSTLAPDVTDILRMATVSGAKILGIGDIVGSLTPGKRADVIVINPNRLNFAPRVDWVEQIIFHTGPENVEWVFVDGVPTKMDGKLIASDLESLLVDAQIAADKVSRVLSSANSEH